MVMLILSLLFPAHAALFNDLLDVDPNDGDAVRSAVSTAAQTGQRIRFTAPMRTPAPPPRPASVRPVVTAKIVDEKGKTITVDGAYRMRDAANVSSGNKGKLAEAKGKIVLNGKRDGDKKQWVGVTYNGQDLWVHQNALRGSHAAVAIEKPEAKPTDTKPVAGTKPDKKTSGPSCVSSYNSAMKSPRFADWIRRANPYTRWNGIMGSYVDVSPSGQAILHHPIKGDLPAMASMCFSASGQPYVQVAGSAFSGRASFPNPQNLNTLSINYEGTNYTFSAR